MEETNVVHVNACEWLLKNQESFKPPICNKIMFNGQLIVFFIKGPNTRNDFHIENGEEIFYMCKGEMNLKLVINDQFKDIIIKEGEIFILPPYTLHSPRRPENSLGFVIERKRDLINEIDGLVYFDEPTTEIKHEVYMHIENFEHQLRDVANKSLKDLQSGNLSTYNPEQKDPPIKPQKHPHYMNPISLQSIIQDNFTELQTKGRYKLCPNNYQSKIEILTYGEFTCFNNEYDTLLWIYKGEASLNIKSETNVLKESDFFVIHPGISAVLSVPQSHYALKIYIIKQ